MQLYKAVMIDTGQIKGLGALTGLAVDGDDSFFDLSGWPSFSFGEKAGYTVVQIPEGRVALTNLVFYLDTVNNAVNRILFDNQQTASSVRLFIRALYFNGTAVRNARVPYDAGGNTNTITLPPLRAVELSYFATPNYGVVTASGLLSPQL